MAKISTPTIEVSTIIPIRLGRIFGMRDKYFLNLQEDIDFHNAKEKRVKSTIKVKSINLFSCFCHEACIFTKLYFKE